MQTQSEQNNRGDLLMPHNLPVYEQLEDAMSSDRSVLLQAATGTGKSYIATAHMQNNPGRWLVVTPKNSLEDMWHSMGKKYGLQLQTVTYQALSTKPEDKVQKMISRYDGFILDEAHHVAALSWSKAVKWIMDTGKPVLGLSANSQRYSDGIDVAESYFSSCVYGYTLGEGIKADILPSFQYVKAMFSVPKFKTGRMTEYQRKAYAKLLSQLQFTVENKHAISGILKKHLGETKHKIIVFVESIKDLPQAKECLEGIVEDKNVFYVSYRAGKTRNMENLKKFSECEETAAVINVNILTEGIHVDGADVLIMLRRTESPSVFFQQLGRIVSATGKGSLYAFDFVGNYRSVKTRTQSTEDAIMSLNTEIGDPERQVIISDYTEEAFSIIRDIESIIGMNWTEQEDAILKEWYPAEGMDVANRLSGRTREACKARAVKLGIQANSRSWTEKESEILRSYYPSEGMAVSKRLPGRTPEACKRQAGKMGVVSGRNWTDEDIQTLKKYYPTEGGAVSKRFTNRSPALCTCKANQLGLFCHAWTEEETEILREQYPRVGSRITEFLPQYSLKACQSKAAKLGIKYNERVWTDEKIEILRREYPTGGATKCAELIGKSKQSCIVMASKLGIKKL